ncbi:hypothetical protein TNCV_3097071 [Trichonephila clavipes]|uniref:Uncharacterized protein n=1 Tax=Trichonephila clavipes TaxID=2585209 RepID=A0A8X6SSH7_TRICX|nr:hypothetical protein TNCV_3097071 [Trichonephila clavipes]
MFIGSGRICIGGCGTCDSGICTGSGTSGICTGSRTSESAQVALGHLESAQVFVEYAQVMVGHLESAQVLGHLESAQGSSVVQIV